MPAHATVFRLAGFNATPPATWSALAAMPTLEHGGCYHQGAHRIDRKLVGSGCCCHFWPPPPPPLSGKRTSCTVRPSDAARFPCDAVLPRRHEPGDVFVVRHRHAARACGRYAVSMSGEVRTWHEDAATFARFVLLEGNASAVELFAFLAAPAPLHVEGSARGGALRALRDAPYLAAAVLENSSLPRVDGCAAAPSVGAFGAEMQRRHRSTAARPVLPRWGGNWSAFVHTLLSQARRVQLAFAMVAASPCNYDLVLRARPDAQWFAPVAWAALGARLSRAPPQLAILDDEVSVGWHGLPFGWRSGLPGSRFCWARDVAAVGPPAALAAFSTIYSDAEDGRFWRSVLVQQRESDGYAWERVVKAHLHWCGVDVAYVRAPCKLSPNRHLNRSGVPPAVHPPPPPAVAAHHHHHG